MRGPTSYGDGESYPGGGRCLKTELLQCGATLSEGSGQCYSCNALPHCLGAVGSGTPAMRRPTIWGNGDSCLGGGCCGKGGTPAMHCHTTFGQWAVEFLRPTAWGWWVVRLLQRTATLLGGGGQWNSCNARAHQLGGRGVLPKRWLLPKTGSRATHCHTAWGQWEVELLHCTASMPRGNETPATCRPTTWGDGEFCRRGNHYRKERNSCSALPHCLRAVRSGKPAMHCHTAWGQWAVEFQQRTAPLPGGNGQSNSCNALPHCPWGSGQCNSCNALPHCLGAVGSATPAMHCHIAWG